MAIDLENALGASLPSASMTWTPDDVILYHLGLGAGGRPTDPNELAYTYERGLRVLPTYGVIPAQAVMEGLLGVPGFDIDPVMVLHGEHDLEVRRPLPDRAAVTSTGRIAAIYDKGSGALVIVEIDTRDQQGDSLFVNRFSLFVRGEGGFGGESGPKAPGGEPDRDPDYVVESPTLPQQALLYRLAGDKNPLHADVEVARSAGFDQPILHGLCSYGVVCKSVIDHAFHGEVGGGVDAVARYQARFASPVFPGETIVTSIWREDGRVLARAHTKERGTPVITNAVITLR